MQLLNAVWYLTFYKDYPGVHKLWVTKQAVLIYGLITYGAAMSTEFVWVVVLSLVPVAFIISHFILWILYKENESKHKLVEDQESGKRVSIAI